jgi:hypothetical protein
MSPRWSSTPRLTDRLTVGRNVTPFATSTLMMETEEMNEALVFSSALTQLIAREKFSTLVRRESFKSYLNVCIYLCLIL